MKERILKISMGVAFVLCTFVFISIRLNSPAMFNLFLAEPAIPEFEDFTTYGENYYNAGLISYFREEMPQANEKFRLSEKNKPPQQADMLLFGDSHFDYSRQTTFPERLADSLGIPVFYHRMEKPHKGNALAFLKDEGYQPGSRKYVFYESSERYVIDRSMIEYQDVGITSNYNPFIETLRNIRVKIFNPASDNLYNTFLKKSYFTTYFYSLITTKKFDWFRYINGQVKDYVIDPQNGSWAFHREQVDFFNRTDISDSLITHCASNIKKLQEKFSRNYNMELVYIIIPEKYAMYNLKNTNKQYHQFIPRMHKELDRLGVKYIDLYSDYSKTDEILYYKTDTHWNKEGVDIAIRNTLGYLKTEHNQ